MGERDPLSGEGRLPVDLFDDSEHLARGIVLCRVQMEVVACLAKKSKSLRNFSFASAATVIPLGFDSTSPSPVPRINVSANPAKRNMSLEGSCLTSSAAMRN